MSDFVTRCRPSAKSCTPNEGFHKLLEETWEASSKKSSALFHPQSPSVRPGLFRVFSSAYPRFISICKRSCHPQSAQRLLLWATDKFQLTETLCTGDNSIAFQSSGI